MKKSITFGDKKTMAENAKMAEGRYGNGSGKPKADKPKPKTQPKVTPIIKKGTVGVKITKEF